MPIAARSLRCPTGEEVADLFQVIANIVVGKFSLEFPFFGNSDFERLYFKEEFS